MHPGDIVAGKYRVTRILGRSRGLLLDARHTDFDQRVVIRLMSPALCDEKELERFRREARTLSKLESEHCARIIDVGTHSDGSFYLVRQYLDGVDLATHLRNQGALRFDQAVLYMLQASEVVQECHSHNIVLRELQPGHLFLAQKRGGNPSLKVLDFGTAKLLKDSSQNLGDGENQATAIFGISNYWSPEMVRKAAIDARTDVWSLGCVFYEMLAAVPAFTGELAELMLKITRDDPTPISRLRPDLPRELDQIMAWALAKDANSRFSSVYALAHALRTYASPEGQVLVDQIGRIAHAGPQQQSEEAAIAPTSPLAAAGAMDDEEDGSSSTVIMQSPANAGGGGDNFEKTAFMGESPFAAAAAANRGSGRGSVPPPRRRTDSSSGRASDPGQMLVNGVTPSGMTTSQPTSTGGFPAATATGQNLKARQRKTAIIAIGAACLLVPVVGLTLFFTMRKTDAPVAENGKKKKKSANPAKPGDPVTEEDVADDEPAAAGSGAAANTSGPTTGTRGPSSGPGPKASASAAPSASVTAKPSAAPSATSVAIVAPQPVGGGKIVGIASGGTCSWQIDGASAGSGSSVTKDVSVGSHTVSCTPPGGATRSQTKKVEPGKPAMALFKLGG